MKQSRSSQRYETVSSEEAKALTEDIISLTSKYGYCRITALLRRKGWQVNPPQAEEDGPASFAVGKSEARSDFYREFSESQQEMLKGLGIDEAPILDFKQLPRDPVTNLFDLDDITRRLREFSGDSLILKNFDTLLSDDYPGTTLDAVNVAKRIYIHVNVNVRRQTSNQKTIEDVRVFGEALWNSEIWGNAEVEGETMIVIRWKIEEEFVLIDLVDEGIPRFYLGQQKTPRKGIKKAMYGAGDQGGLTALTSYVDSSSVLETETLKGLSML